MLCAMPLTLGTAAEIVSQRIATGDVGKDILCRSRRERRVKGIIITLVEKLEEVSRDV